VRARILANVIAMAVLASIAVQAHLVAQDPEVQNEKHSVYTVKDLGTLGGTVSSGANSINNKGWVTGHSNLPGDQEEHAFLWRKGVMTDLGTLGGFNSNVPFPVKNDEGLIAAQSQTSALDPLGENFFGPYTCDQNGDLCQGGDLINRGFVWQDGAITALATLGGNNGVAAGANDRGEVVGFAENTTQDPSCAPPQVLDWEAVIWGPKRGEIHQLPPFPGDSVAAALAVNDHSQVVGGSGICGPVSPAVSLHAVLWQVGSVINLGGLGGAMNNVAFAINNRGQVVGFSDLSGDATFHAFLWEDGIMTDLGTLPGDFSSSASGINNRGQVVGTSCDQNGNCRVFLWENGVMTDLNTLVPQRSSLYLTVASDINDRGEIVGNAVPKGTDYERAFLAVPSRDGDDRETTMFAAHVGGNPIPKIVLPENVRGQLRQRRGLGRFAAGLMRPHER
jgi:probable HAF family extracellular repeat protein